MSVLDDILTRDLSLRASDGLKIPRVFYDQIKAHTIETAPEECCGLIACLDNRVIQVYPVRNVAPDPIVTFEADHRDIVCALASMQEAAYELWGSYHSHTMSGPEPSLRDRKQLWTNCMHLIVGMDGGLEMKGWAMYPDRYEEVPVTVL